MLKYMFFGLAGAMTAIQANADVLQTSEAWQAFGGNVNSDPAKPICGINSETTDKKHTIYLEWFGGMDGIVIDIPKSDITARGDIPIKASIIFDEELSWNIEEVVNKINTKAAQFLVEKKNVRLFFRRFTNASTMKMQFSDGTNAPWVWNMQGSSDVLNTMISCVSQEAAPDKNPFDYLEPYDDR